MSGPMDRSAARRREEGPMAAETGSFDDLAARYLDGELSVAEAETFEQALFRTDVARDLKEELLLRELLRTMPPDTPPEGLAPDIEAMLAMERGEETGRKERFVTLRAALRGMGWMVNGPRLALSGFGVGSTGTSQSMQGLSTVRYALGPLALSLQGSARKERPKARSFWRRVPGWIR